jgi:hypothetical protein
MWKVCKDTTWAEVSLSTSIYVLATAFVTECVSGTI